MMAASIRTAMFMISKVALLSTLALAANQRKVLLQFADKGPANPPAI